MKERSSECKDNNAVIVKGMMPGRAWVTAAPTGRLSAHIVPVIAGSGWQKQLDIGFDESIIIFT